MLWRCWGPVFLALSALLGALCAGEEKPFRPIPELPDVLYYEGFETAVVTWKKGKVVTWRKGKVEAAPGQPEGVEAPGMPDGSHSFKLDPGDWNGAQADNWVYSYGEFPFRFPGGLDPAEISMQFMFWADDPGLELNFKLKSAEGDFEKKTHPPKAKAWTAISLHLNDFTKDNKRPSKIWQFKAIEVSFKPKDKTKTPAVFIDDFIVTYGSRPADVVGRAAVIFSKVAVMSRSLERDGFTYGPLIQDGLKTAVKALKKPKKPRTVLVVGAQTSDTAELVKSLTAEMAKQKAPGFTFIPATTPDGLPLSGFDDMRTLLSYNAQKNEAEMALLVLGTADMNKPGRQTESMRVVLERLLEAGCVPILCAPSSGGGSAAAAAAPANPLQPPPPQPFLTA